jgi:hypothetical protein
MCLAQSMETCISKAITLNTLGGLLQVGLEDWHASQCKTNRRGGKLSSHLRTKHIRTIASVATNPGRYCKMAKATLEVPCDACHQGFTAGRKASVGGVLAVQGRS